MQTCPILARAYSLTVMSFDAGRTEQERDELRAEAIAMLAGICVD